MTRVKKCIIRKFDNQKMLTPSKRLKYLTLEKLNESQIFSKNKVLEDIISSKQFPSFVMSNNINEDFLKNENNISKILNIIINILRSFTRIFNIIEKWRIRRNRSKNVKSFRIHRTNRKFRKIIIFYSIFNKNKNIL